MCTIEYIVKHISEHIVKHISNIHMHMRTLTYAHVLNVYTQKQMRIRCIHHAYKTHAHTLMRTHAHAYAQILIYAHTNA